MPRVLTEVALTYRLATPTSISPTTQEKRWFFEVPQARNNELVWRELLSRMFFNTNCMLRLNQPYDLSWLVLDTFVVTPIDTATVLGWDGDRSVESAGQRLPWCFLRPVWEPAVCFFVDEVGRYDALDPNSFSELVAYRALEAGADSEAVRRFIGHVFPDEFAAKVWEERRTRLSNIACIRDPNPIPAFKAPGQGEVTCEPPQVIDIDSGGCCDH